MKHFGPEFDDFRERGIEFIRLIIIQVFDVVDIGGFSDEINDRGIKLQTIGMPFGTTAVNESLEASFPINRKF